MVQQLVGMSQKEITDWILEQGEKPFRGQQLSKWVYQKKARDFAEMTDLSKALRESLGQEAEVSSQKIQETVRSKDGTTKFLVQLADGQIIECVTIVQANHLTACVSSQVGCNVGCPFCATGLSGFRRNLTAGEIVDQYLIMQKALEDGFLKDFTSHERISRIVFMGMGEPLLNYKEVLKSIAILNEEIGIGMRHITISTSGVIPKIEALSQEDKNYNLAISLHSVSPTIRDELVPINQKYKVHQLLEAAKNYANTTKRRVTFEYTMLQGYNASLEDAKQMAKNLKGIHCHINLIAYNPVDSPFQAPPRKEIEAFQKVLKDAGFPVTIRHNHGSDDMAACGQLRLKDLEKVAQ